MSLFILKELFYVNPNLNVLQKQETIPGDGTQHHPLEFGLKVPVEQTHQGVSKNIKVNFLFVSLHICSSLVSQIHQKKFQPSTLLYPTQGGQYVTRPPISQNSSCPENRLLCTQKERIHTTVLTQQSKKRSEVTRLRNCPKTADICTFE